MSMGRTMPQMSQQDLAPLVGEQAAVDINQQMSQINQEGLATQELAEGPDMTGGIDFNPENFEVQVKGEGLSVTYLDKTFDIDNIEGFTFKILNVSRI
jgi:hypothetical protein